MVSEYCHHRYSIQIRGKTFVTVDVANNLLILIHCDSYRNVFQVLSNVEGIDLTSSCSMLAVVYL